MGNTMAVILDASFTKNYMEVGNCGDEFVSAIHRCHPSQQAGGKALPAAAEERVRREAACAKATAALRKCMARNKRHFAVYLDRGLDEDFRRRGEPIDEPEGRFPWWAGMRR